MIQYEDFSIRIEPKRGDLYPVRVWRSPAGEGDSDFQPAFNLDELGDLLVVLGQTVRGTGRRDAARAVTPRTDPRELGQQLFDALFTGPVRSLLDRSQGMLHGQDCGLRIKLHIDPEDPGLAPLASLPWELLYRKETHDFLSLSQSTPVVRYLDIERPCTPLALEPPLRILVVISSATGLQKLDLDREQALIEQSWAQQAGVEVEFMEEATVQALQDRLAGADYHVLHFMGHGDFDEASGQGVLLMEDAEGGGEPVDGYALGVLLHDARTLRLVVLNACETARVSTRQGLDPFAGVATALVLAGIPAVVAMQFPISDGAAVTFAERFYPLLAQGRPVDYAVTEARKAIYVAEPGAMEWATPVLFMRAPEGVLFEVREAQPPEVIPAGPLPVAFESHLQTQQIAAGERGRVTVRNLGERAETFQLTWQDAAQVLAFEPAQTELLVPPGEPAAAPFLATPRQRRWVGGEKAHPFAVEVTSAAKETQTHPGEVVSKGLVPVWVPPLAIAVLALFGFLLSLLLPGSGDGSLATPTQVAVATTAIPHTPRLTAMPTTEPSPLPPLATDTPAPTASPAPTRTPTPTARPVPPANVRFARPGGLSDGACDSWDNACELQCALSQAVAGEEVWMMAGTYLPDYDCETGRHTGDREATFALRDDVAIYGGFAGTETSREARDWGAHETTLSGDVGKAGVHTDNSYHVLKGGSLKEGVLLDGFTITGGYAVSDGSKYWDRKLGGGLSVFLGTLTLRNLRFEYNTADVCGGGLYLNHSDASLFGVTFRSNSQLELWGRPCGGGGLCLDKSNASLTNVTFRRNTAEAGGGMYNWKSGPTLANCSFSENVAESGGGMQNVEGSSPRLLNVTFGGNQADGAGGAMFNEDSSSPLLHNCILWGNTAPDGVQIWNDGSTPDIDSSDIEGSGGSVAWNSSLGRDLGGNLDVDPLFVNAAAGDLHLRWNSPAKDQGTNVFVTAGVDLDGNPRIVDDVVDMGAYEIQGDD